MSRRLAVIGSGTWGTAASALVAPHVDEVIIWARREEVARSINERSVNPAHLPTLHLPDNVHASSSLEEVFDGTTEAVLAVPSAFLRRTCHEAAPYVPSDLPLLILTKGIEPGTCLLMADLVAEELGCPERVAVLSGPNHAEEIAEGKVSAAVIAAHDPRMSLHFQQLFVSPTFRAYASTDLIGVEVCGAAKNVIAIASGIATGLDFGDNTLAVLMTRGLAEIGRLSAACGGDPLTCMGLAGMGDLVVTCTSRHSRNRSFGQALAQGETLESYERRTGMVVEGAQAALSAWELAHRLDVEVPVINAIHAILYEGATLDEAVGYLLRRSPHEEFYGMA